MMTLPASGGTDTEPGAGTILIHGGPGAPGSLGPLAAELGEMTPLVEHRQQAFSISALLEELRSVQEINCSKKAILLGHSWGAWLSLIYASAYPEQVKKLILVGCPPFHHSEVAQVLKTRMDRLDSREKSALDKFQKQLKSSDAVLRNLAFAKMGRLIEKADTYSLQADFVSGTEYNFDQYAALWEEAHQIRKSGKFTKIIQAVTCHITAIHGTYDPHPAKAVKNYLSRYHSDFKMILLEKCGHEPWREIYARDLFFDIVKRELADGKKL